MAKRRSEPKKIQGLYRELTQAPMHVFPKPRGRIEAPKEKGVYIIYDRHKTVCHVGAAPRGKGGLKQRLANHLATQSSFTINYKPLRKSGKNLRGKYCYRFLEVPDQRALVLLEAYAVGNLCPAHIGLHQLKNKAT